MRKAIAILISLLIPAFYIGSLAALKSGHLPVKLQYFIYQNSLLLWVGQLTAIFIGFFLVPQKPMRFFLIFLVIVFLFVEFETIETFRGASAQFGQIG